MICSLWMTVGSAAGQEQDAGLHFLLRVDTSLSDRELTGRLEGAGIRVQALSDYYHQDRVEDLHCLVVNYSGVKEELLEKVLGLLPEIL